MDTNRWKSIIVPKEMYEELLVIKDVEGRTLSGQLRFIFSHWKDDNLSAADKRFIAEKIEGLRESGKLDPLV